MRESRQISGEEFSTLAAMVEASPGVSDFTSGPVSGMKIVSSSILRRMQRIWLKKPSIENSLDQRKGSSKEDMLIYAKQLALNMKISGALDIQHGTEECLE